MKLSKELLVELSRFSNYASINVFYKIFGAGGDTLYDKFKAHSRDVVKFYAEFLTEEQQAELLEYLNAKIEYEYKKITAKLEDLIELPESVKMEIDDAVKVLAVERLEKGVAEQEVVTERFGVSYEVVVEIVLGKKD